MATVVLGAAGAAVGGAAGRAIGSFLGRQIDRSFGRGASGRRVSDVRLPSAQYGDPIPRVLRRMRVAGLLLWASPPVPTATVSKSGTGQGSSVSFAYALSTGQVDAIGRIWADGRLIRDAEGQQAVTFSMRLHSGNEDQPRDPLLASVIGVDRTPAYRGLAYLVFENFDLSSFGNRLPLITVELASESEALSVLRVIGTHLDVPCEENDRGRPLEGLALSGDDQAIALQPLVAAFQPDFSYGPNGWSLDRSSSRHVIDDELWLLDTRKHSLAEVGGVSDIPTRVSLRYFDPEIDFAASEKSARLPGPERLKRIELPAAMHGAHAKAAAFEQLTNLAQDTRQVWLDLPQFKAEQQLLGYDVILVDSG